MSAPKRANTSATNSGFTGFGTAASSTGSMTSLSLFSKPSTTAASYTSQSRGALPSVGVTPTISTTAVISSTSASTQTSSTLVATSRIGTTPTSTTASLPKLPSEIIGKTVEEIIKEWKAELQERAGKFRKIANAIAEWDNMVLQNRDTLFKLECEVAKVYETKGILEQQLDLIGTHQDEVDRALQSVEEEADRLYREERGLLLDDDAASTRDAVYEHAELTERELEQITGQIESIRKNLNATQAGELDATDEMTPLDVVVQILNNQLGSLMWINKKAEELSSRIQKLGSHGSASVRKLSDP